MPSGPLERQLAPVHTCTDPSERRAAARAGVAVRQRTPPPFADGSTWHSMFLVGDSNQPMPVGDPLVHKATVVGASVVLVTGAVVPDGAVVPGPTAELEGADGAGVDPGVPVVDGVVDEHTVAVAAKTATARRADHFVDGPIRLPPVVGVGRLLPVTRSPSGPIIAIAASLRAGSRPTIPVG